MIDKLTPLSFTTAQSGENFRQFWPQPWMNDFVSHSIDLMEQLLADNPNAFKMRFSGYDFVSHQKHKPILSSPETAGQPPFDLYDDPAFIHAQKPYLAPDIQQLVHIQRAGALDVYALGSLLLKKARSRGVQLIQADIKALKPIKTGGYKVIISKQKALKTDQLVLCSGPFVAEHAKQLGFELPIYSVIQRKFVMPDPAGIIPRDMPFTIYADQQALNWTDEERELIQCDEQYLHLLLTYPAGLHIKPEGSQQIKLGWAYNTRPSSPRWEIPEDQEFREVVLHGASRFIPGLKQYVDQLTPGPITEFGGYYTRTAENLPIIGKLDDGLYTIAALAGYGTMSACAAGELCADIVGKDDLPAYAPYFAPQRYQDHDLMARINEISGDGQL